MLTHSAKSGKKQLRDRESRFGIVAFAEVEQEGFFRKLKVRTQMLLSYGLLVVVAFAVLVLLVMLAGVTSLPRDAWWQDSVFIAKLEHAAIWARGYLPPDVAGAITFPGIPDGVSGDDDALDASIN